MLPSEFVIANQPYKIIFVDEIPGGYYGEFDSIKSEIRIAKRVRSPYDDELYDLTEEQIKNTFWHELFHCFNWHWNTEDDESLAQTFANFMREFETTKK